MEHAQREHLLMALQLYSVLILILMEHAQRGNIAINVKTILFMS